MVDAKNMDCFFVRSILFGGLPATRITSTAANDGRVILGASKALIA